MSISTVIHQIFKGSLSLTYFDSFIEGLTTVFYSLKVLHTTIFVSGYFEATEEGKGEESQVGQSWSVNPGQIGGELYSDLDFVYQVNENINFWVFLIKKFNFESQAPTFPLSPKIPRYFLVETGYSF